MYEPRYRDPRLEAEGIHFREVQRFRQPWVLAIVLIAPLTILFLFGYGILQQIGRGEPWGNRPLSDTGLLIVSAVTFILACMPAALIAWMSLVTEVRSDRIVIRFTPFPARQIPFTDIVRFEARTYRPIREYGGWGIRYTLGKRGMAYNVSGNRGLQLELSGGKRVLIGSLRADEMESVLRDRLQVPERD